MPQDTTLVFVGYNSAHLLKKRLALFGEGPIVVADNASQDETHELLKRDFPAVKLIANETNQGYGRAANRAIAEVETAYALLVNPDVELTPEAVLRLEAHAESLGGDWLLIAPETGLGPGRIGSTDPSDGALDASVASGRDGVLVPVDFASGAALFFNVEAFRAIGGFDSNIFLFFEETDLCRRAAAAGWAMYFDPAVEVGHEIGTSSERTLELDYVRKWHYHWSLLYYCRKHGLWTKLLMALWKNLIVAPLKLPFSTAESKRYARCHARFDSAKAFLLGRGAFDPSGGPVRNRFLNELARR